MNNLDLSLSPKCGYCLAYLVDSSTILDAYKIEDNCLKLKNHKIADIEQFTKFHLFDDKKEYRVIHHSSSNKVTAVVLTEEEENTIDPLYIKEQIIYLDDAYKINNKKCIRVINRFNFDEDNCIYLENYRLAGLI